MSSKDIVGGRVPDRGALRVVTLVVGLTMVMTVMTSITISNAVNAEEVPLTDLVVHSPTEIDGNVELALAADSGAGTFSSPYIIQGWAINATGFWNALKISNTDAHLIIRDCNLSYADYWTGGASYVERSGLHLVGVSNVTVVNVTAFDNRNGGIRLGNCRNITITGCTLMGSGRPGAIGVEGDGIIIHSSIDVLVESCVIYDNMYSDVILDSEYSTNSINVTLRDCHMSGSRFGIFVYSSMVFGFTVENCTISDFTYCGFWSRNDGLPNRQTGWIIRNITVENDDQISTFGAVHLYHLTGAIIEDVEIRHMYGTHDEEVLQLFCCDNTTVTNSWFHDNFQIALQTLSCQNITFMDSTITNGTQGGIRIDQSKDVTISGMFIDGISGQGMGIITMTSSRITVHDCTITNNLGHGVYVYTGTEHLEVRDCVISGNGYTTITGYGFFIYDGIGDVTVVNNTFTNNHGAGATYDIHHVQALDAGLINHWNDSDGGNRWSDWLGPDADYDGFVDVPYNIDGNADARDMLPLADPEDIPPEVVITAPGNGAILTSTDVTVEWGAWDNQTGLGHIEVTVDSDAPVNVGLNTSIDLSLSEGAHTVTVTVYDNDGNNGSDSVSFSITLPTVPGQPSGLTADPSDSSAFLSWTAPDDGGSPITIYHVYRGDDAVNLTEIDTTDQLQFTDSGLVNGNVHYYAVSAENAVGEGAQSEVTSVTPANVPGAPLNLTALVNGTSVELTWEEPEDNGSAILHYNIYRGTTGDLVKIDESNGTWYADEGLDGNTTYRYQVSAENAVGEGTLSPEIQAFIVVAPDAPTDLELSVYGEGVLVEWNAPLSDGGSPILQYDIYRGLSAGNLGLIGNVSVLSFNDMEAIPGNTYYYAVSAENAMGEGESSSVRNITYLTLPGVPQDLQAEAVSDGIMLTWSAPVSD